MKILTTGLLLLGAFYAVAQSTPSVQTETSGGKSTSDGRCGLLYGKNHSLTFCAPSGWTLDSGILNDEGIYAAFYPDGSSWNAAKESGTIMYINVVSKATDDKVQTLMERDAKEAKDNAPATIVKQGDPIRIGEASTPVVRFTPGAFDRYEAVAYVGEEKVLVMFVVSSKNEAIFKKDYPSFVQLVQSYKFLSSNVNIEHK